MYIDTINTLKAKSLNGKKKGKLNIAGCETTAESYGIYLEVPDRPTLCIAFSFTKNKWVMNWAFQDKQVLLPKSVSNKDFKNAIIKFIKES